VKQTMVRINRVSVRMRDHGSAGAVEIGAKVAAQLTHRTGIRLPIALQNELAARVAAALPRPRRK
jgi:hypothetical protein